MGEARRQGARALVAAATKLERHRAAKQARLTVAGKSRRAQGLHAHMGGRNDDNNNNQVEALYRPAREGGEGWK